MPKLSNTEKFKRGQILLFGILLTIVLGIGGCIGCYKSASNSFAASMKKEAKKIRKHKEANQPSTENSTTLAQLTEYKNVVFQRCLFLGFNKSKEIRELMKLDRSTHQDFAFGLEEYKYIDSMVLPIVEEAKLDSIAHFENHLKGMNEIEMKELNGLPMMRYCLEFYESEELERIVVTRLNKMNGK